MLAVWSGNFEGSKGGLVEEKGLVFLPSDEHSFILPDLVGAEPLAKGLSIVPEVREKGKPNIYDL